mgnify:FL=1|tara:strand:+ start:9289 stop:10701 length:1413 start_codon:yes stop_codon:yes gene_type:complete
MCGIILTYDRSRINSISHRGLEFECFQGNGDFSRFDPRKLNIAHHRLPIQTKDGDRWSQPFRYMPGRYFLFNGEIFNYDLLKFESDTEYLRDFFGRLKTVNLETLSQNWVKKEMSSWDGFWSIVHYDDNTGDIIALTDPLGKKQLYTNFLGEVCSEIAPLTIGPSLDSSYIASIHKWGYNHDDKTPFPEVKRLLPNNIYSWNTLNPKIVTTFKGYYDISPIETKRDSIKTIRRLLRESVERRLISNYPISFLLSGGLDSTILASILIELKADVTWYTIENGEDEYVKMCEDRWGIKVNRLKYSIDGNDDLPEIYCKWNETPVDLGSVVPQYYLFKAIAETGHRVVLSGDGADELFGGYKRINEFDSQGSDVFHELTYYHLPRLDRMSMAHTLELRSPFLGHEVVRFALGLPFELRKNKEILKRAYRGDIPDEIIDRKKEALKNDKIKKDPLKYRKKVLDLYQKSVENFLY